MGPGYFVIAILGCADGGGSCTPVTTLQTRYESEQQCSAATPAALENNNNFDFPTLVASCRSGAPRASTQKARPRMIPAGMRRD